MIVFKTKDGITLEHNNNEFTSTDMEAVKEALLEEYKSKDIIASTIAQYLLSVL